MSDIQIHLLGQFQVNLGGEAVSSFVSDKARALLAYLAAESHHPHRRETLACLLWPDKPESRARANLRRALANLREVVQDSQADPPCLLITHQDIKFNLSPRVWVDVDVVSRIHEIQKATPKNIAQYDEILDIYQGEFLAGFTLPDSLPFDEWALMKREQHARMMVAILQRASNYYEKRGEYESALLFAWRHVELEPWQDKARRQLMRLLFQTGRQDEALQQYLDLESALQSELGIKPGAKTRQLYKSILEGKDDFLSKFPPSLEDEPVPLPAFLQVEDTEHTLPPEPFVGRRQELERLHTQLDAMLKGQGNIMMIAGEAGSGKTMLVREFIRQAQSRYPNLVSATGYSNAFTGAGDPYLPFREILYQLSGDIEAHWKAGSFSRQYALNLWNAIPITSQSLLTHGPDLIDAVIPGQTLLQFAASYSKFQPSWYTELKEHIQHKQQYPGSAVQQANLLSQFTTVLQTISNQVPLLLFLDDLQWTDTGTIGMLFHLYKHIPQSRMMLIGAYRSEEVGFMQEDGRHPLIPLLHEIQRDFGEVFVNLDLSSGGDFVQSLVISEPNKLGEDFREQLFQLTGGHALFTVELLRSMQESGALVQDRHGFWGLKPDFHLQSLPAKVEGIIAERISRLSEHLQRVLAVASIEGEIFTAEIIAAVQELPVDQVISLLSDHLDKRHRLVRADQINWSGEQSISTYRFRHFLFQKYLYDRLDAIEQVRYHERVGREMENLAGEDKQAYAVYLARHFHHANQAEKAVSYYTLAGERAAHMSAYPEAIKQYESAIELLLSLPETPARHAQEMGLQLQRGLAYQAIMGFSHEQVGKAYKRARELSPDVHDPIKVITTLHLLFSYYANMAEFDIAREIMTLLEKSYAELGEDGSENENMLGLGYGYLDSLLGHIKSAADNYERVLPKYNIEKHRSISMRLGMEVGIYSHGWGGLHLTWLGYPKKAKEHIQAAFGIAEEYHSKLFTNDALFFSTWISLEMEDLAAARIYADELMELTTQEHYFLYEAVARVYKGRILSRDAKHPEAIASILKGLEMFSMTGMVASQTFFLHALAEAYCAAGQGEEGLEVILKAEQIERKIGEERHKSALQRVKGDLYLLGGDEIAAEEAYLNAIAVAQEESAKLLELVAVKRLARLWQCQGKAKQAIQMLQGVYDWFTEGFDTPMLIEARELLEDLSS